MRSNEQQMKMVLPSIRSTLRLDGPLRKTKSLSNSPHFNSIFSIFENIHPNKPIFLHENPNTCSSQCCAAIWTLSHMSDSPYALRLKVEYAGNQGKNINSTRIATTRNSFSKQCDNRYHRDDSDLAKRQPFRRNWLGRWGTRVVLTAAEVHRA